MKKILILLSFVMIFTACNNVSKMDNITIYTTSYPIEYVVTRLYKEHSIIKSIYPNGTDINTYKLTDVLLSEYSNSDMFIFSGLTKEQDYVKPLLKENNNLKIIDATSDIKYANGIEELWLDPSKLLTLANNIKKGFTEYVGAKYLSDEINNNYEELKIDLTNLEANYRKTIRNAKNVNVVINDDIFLFLSNYGINVISLDKDNPDYEKNVLTVKDLIDKKLLNYIYIKDTDDETKISNIEEFTTENIQIIKLNTLSNLTDEQRNNYDYLTLMTENLENLKKQLYDINIE